MSNDFKLEIQLEQYTPLLHFQGDKAGACLRATEVKPKLDRFVLAYIQRKGITLPDSWFAKKENKEEFLAVRSALQYKMRFEAVGDGNPQEFERGKSKTGQCMPEAALYFGFIGKKDSFGMRSLFYKDGIRMTILCFIPGLMELLIKLIVPFFAMHCFGTRSNKGFGSFGVKKFTSAPQGIELPSVEITPDQLKDYLPAGVPALYAGKCVNTGTDKNGNTYENMLYCIASISAMMKGGINFTEKKGREHYTEENGREHYFRGSIITYCGKKYGVHSEKALIKRDVLPDGWKDHVQMKTSVNEQKIAKQDDNCSFVRGILGLPQTYTYKTDLRKSDGKPDDFIVTVEGAEKEMDSKGKPTDNAVIQRFGNPIHFKPHGKFLLLIPQGIPNTLRDEKNSRFILRCKRKTEKVQTIQLPLDFDLDAFLRYYSDIYNRRNEIAKENTELGTQMKSILTFNGGSFRMKKTFESLQVLKRYEKEGDTV